MKKESDIRGPTFTMVGTPDYMAPEVREIVGNCTVRI